MENNEQNTENIEINSTVSNDNLELDKVQDEVPGEPLEAKIEGQEEKVHTQTEVNEIISNRLARQNIKHNEALEQLHNDYKEKINILEMKFKALEQEYNNYKLDVEFQKERNKLLKLGIPKEAIESLRAIKQIGDVKSYETLREVLISERLKGSSPKVAADKTKINPKRVSFLD